MISHFVRSVPFRILLLLPAGLLLFMLARAAPVQAAGLPAGFSETLVAGGLAAPTAFAFAPDGRIFVTAQYGDVRVIDKNGLQQTPFAHVTVEFTGERGLLGITLHPNFPTTPYVYVYYTVPGDPSLGTSPHNRISRFVANGNVADASGEHILVDLDNLGSDPLHNGGGMHFGPDGYLYVGVGENNNPFNAEVLTNQLGKLLRFDENGVIPDTNPFYDGGGPQADAIWAYGLRNPFSFAFQPGTGRLFINDVGGGAWEEINDGIAGSDYGWPSCEGWCDPPRTIFRDPLFAYAHGESGIYGCAIVGGAFYNPATQQFPADYVGNYFFADMCKGWIHRYDVSKNQEFDFATGIPLPVDLHVSPDGALYYLARQSGEIWRVTYSASQTGTSTPTGSLTATKTRTPTATKTRTATPTGSLTATRTKTLTATPTGSLTATRTATVTQTPTRTHTPGSSTPPITQTPCAVSKPVLLKPPADAVANKARVRLKWVDDACADYYRVKLRKLDKTGKQSAVVTASKYRTESLDPAGQYQFRVWACNAVRCERTKWRNFSISANPKP